MAIIEAGRLCVKIAGRDAGRECIIVDVTDKNFVLIDGNTRRRKCNVDHLELLPQKADLKKGASHEETVKALEALGIKVLPKSPAKPQKAKAESKTDEKPKEKKGLLKRVKKEEKPKAEKAAKKEAEAKA
jgi:large subunit ribosomal protein L14e